MTKHLFISTPELSSDRKREHQSSIEENNTIRGSYLGLLAKNNLSVNSIFEYSGYGNGDCLSC